MNESPIKVLLEVKVTPLTPTHVGSGSRGIVGYDLIRTHHGSYCIVNLEEALNEMMRSYEELPSDTSELLAALREFVRINEKPCIRCPKGSEVPQGAEVALMSPALIPGSSLKGLIRTAVLYHELREIAIQSPSRFINIINSGVILDKKADKVSEGLEAQFFRHPRLSSQKGFIDSFQTLLVSDPLKLEGIRTYVIKSEVLKLPALSKVAESYLEALTAGTLTYSIAITDVPKEDKVEVTDRVIRKLRRRKGMHHIDKETIIRELREIMGRLLKLDFNLIRDSLRTFSYDLMDYELSKIQPVNNLEEYKEFLRKLKNSNSSNCYYLRLGFMSGHMSKTIDLLLAKYFPQKYNEVKSSMRARVRRHWDDTTLKVTRIEGKYYGLGWVKLCVE